MSYHVERLSGGISDEMKAHYDGLNVEGYFLWKLQMDVQEFIRSEINKLGLNIETE